ncbi:hypothetical protein ID866_8021 [Astraeus odoratus]|nr:hypothetical protein ID866_8021 [Astraeus odoratus]
MSRETERAASELLYSRILRARLLPFSDTKDLEPIFELLRSAKEFGATDHSLLLDIYAELSTLHFLKYLLTQQPSELTEALGHHELSLAFSRGTSIPAFHASMQWVTDAELHGHSSGVEAYRTAMRLLDRLILEMRSPELRQCMVTRNGIVLAIDAGSCGIRFGQADEGVEMLEQGRELTWTQMVRVMTALDDLRATGEQGVALFNEFERLSAKLKSIPRISSVMSKSCKLLHKERESVIDQIRRKEGLKGFLLPPLFNHLQKVASDGPVIIVNASQYSCDAVIIWQTGQPAHVPLPDISLRDVSLMASKFAALAKASAPLRYDVAREKQLKEALSDLWDQVVYPIIKRLIPCTPRGARLWWCPTGKFTSIPLHAACPYRTGEPALSHVYVSSYTSTLSALARSRAISTPSSLHRTSLTSGLTVFLKNRKSKQLLTPPPSPLSLRNPPAALIAVGNPVSGEKNDQLDFIKMRIPPGVPFKRIEGEDMSVVTVTNALRETAWVHFTCPVVHNPARPFRTEFKTQDGNLTLYDIARIGPKVDFAFVSTCQNAKVDVGPVEEPMPLPSCLQYMGFKSVVGTIWPVDEEVTRRVVSVFYENVVSRTGGSLHHTDTAKVLNQALRAIEETVPLSQRIAFVHVGM